jgi:uncharacterized HAD superfamily protein
LNVAIDIDGIMCAEGPLFERSLQRPLDNVKDDLWRIKQCGHFIIILTSRGWPEYKYTKKWLVDNNLPHDVLVCGKPNYDFILDDRSCETWERLKACLNIK